MHDIIKTKNLCDRWFWVSTDIIDMKILCHWQFPAQGWLNGGRLPLPFPWCRSHATCPQHLVVYQRSVRQASEADNPGSEARYHSDQSAPCHMITKEHVPGSEAGIMWQQRNTKIYPIITEKFVENHSNIQNHHRLHIGVWPFHETPWASSWDWGHNRKHQE